MFLGLSRRNNMEIEAKRKHRRGRMMAKTWQQVLVYSLNQPSRRTIRRYYEQYRNKHGMPLRCDIVGCYFHTQPLIWNGKELPLVLDHKNGNYCDSRPENLRLVCPPCNSQLPTTGGDRARVREKTEVSFVLYGNDGQKIHVHLGSGGVVVVGRASWAVYYSDGAVLHS
jgi:hypothetical protein